MEIKVKDLLLTNSLFYYSTFTIQIRHSYRIFSIFTKSTYQRVLSSDTLKNGKILMQIETPFPETIHFNIKLLSTHSS